MKKPAWTNVVLLALPLLMVLVTSNPSGVTVFDGETTAYCSWLQPVASATFGWCVPAAALLNYVLFGLAVLYAVTKKSWCLSGIYGIAFGAVCIAALPIVAQSGVKVVPSVAGLLLLTAQWLTASVLRKKAAAEEKEVPKGKRLERH
jgi:hypothetical protein